MFVRFFWLLTAASLVSAAQASVVVDGTRLIFEGDKKETSIAVENKDAIANLVQSWLEPAVGNAVVDTLIVTPPLFRLATGERNVVRILKTGKPLAENVETLYWLNVKGIPATRKDNSGSRVQLAVNNRIKLIYRPSVLKNNVPDGVTEKLKWNVEGNTLRVKNDTPYYMNFYEIKVGGKAVAQPDYVAPNGQKTWSLPAGVSGTEVHWWLINDFGVKGVEHPVKR